MIENTNLFSEENQELSLYTLNVRLNELENNDASIDTSLSPTSKNPVQNKVIYSELNKKVNKEDGKGLSTNDYTTEEQTKLSGIEEGANKTIIDNVLNSTSTNPVQNKIINAKLTSIDKNMTNVASLPLGICNTAGHENTKEITIPNLDNINIEDNFQLLVVFNNDNTATGPELIINNFGGYDIFDYADIGKNATHKTNIKANVLYLVKYINEVFYFLDINNNESKVDKTTTINGKVLNTNIEITAEDIGINKDNDLLPTILPITRGGTGTSKLASGSLLMVGENNFETLSKPNNKSYVSTDNNFNPIWEVADNTPIENSKKLITSGAIHSELNKKVNKEDGKGLSTNDYTTAEKNKLDSISQTFNIENNNVTVNANTLKIKNNNGLYKVYDDSRFTITTEDNVISGTTDLITGNFIIIYEE